MNKDFQERRNAIKNNMKGIDYRIGIMSGKGGVGKTTIAVNLATSLAKESSVSLLDADIDCPNVNKFLGIRKKFSMNHNKIIPLKKYGFSIVSFASLMEKEDSPVIWRGPMLSNALMEILEKVDYPETDYLIIDLPSGTSDLPLTVMQELEPDGIIIITTPQDVAVMDAKKSVNMVKKMGIPVLGVIENMSSDIFGEGGGEEAAKDLGVDFLGRLGLDKKISKSTNEARPFVLDDSELREAFERIVCKIKTNLNR